MGTNASVLVPCELSVLKREVKPGEHYSDARGNEHVGTIPLVVLRKDLSTRIDPNSVMGWLRAHSPDPQRLESTLIVPSEEG